MKTIVLLMSAILTIPVLADSTNQDLVYFTQPEAQVLLDQSLVKGDFPSSVRYFVSEVKQTYCAVASSVIVLNSLEVESPVAPEIYPYQKI